LLERRDQFRYEQNTTCPNRQILPEFIQFRHSNNRINYGIPQIAGRIAFCLRELPPDSILAAAPNYDILSQ